jgi:hypothetical protein
MNTHIYRCADKRFDGTQVNKGDPHPREHKSYEWFNDDGDLLGYARIDGLPNRTDGSFVMPIGMPDEFTSHQYLGAIEMECTVSDDNELTSVGGGELLKDAQELMRTHMYRYRVAFEGKKLKHRIRTGVADDGLVIGITTTFVIEE